ncbi:Hypothetical predicted protein [Mytilus galloprovincialis]|uniref:Uncharacterized protein n=1 Tax=Mytilus galloprovincialis TaxID=29158 RepID=A0A8B6D7F5_MYTGA|nr:Hypothetical predicted protein [Mytilus galloprovincialis]
MDTRGRPALRTPVTPGRAMPSKRGSTGRPDVPFSSEGSPVRPDGLTTSSGEDPPQDRGTEGMDMSEKTRKRGRDDDPAEEEQEDNGKKLVKEEELERTGPLALPIKCNWTIDVDYIGQVIAALEDVVDVRNLEAIYKTGEGNEWYLTFITDAEVVVLGDGSTENMQGKGISCIRKNRQ